MANINGNNIDDLFRQAADQYPLRTDSSDWDKLAGTLEANPSLISNSPLMRKEDRRRRFLWLLLVLPLGGLGYYTWQGRTHGHAEAMVKPGQAIGQGGQAGGAANQHGVSAKAVPGKNTAAIYVKAGADTKETQGSNTGAGTKEEEGLSKGEGSITGAGTKEGLELSKAGAGAGEKMGTDTRTGINAKGTVGANAIADADRRNIEDKTTNGAGAGERTGTDTRTGINAKGTVGANAMADRRNTDRRNIEAETTNGVGAGKAGIGDGSAGGKDETGSGVPRDAQFSKVDAQRAMTAGDISVQVVVRGKGVDAPSSKPEPSPKKAKTNQHSFYVGILGAPDLSTIQFQQVKSVGTTFGVLAGYTLSRKWSVETGLYLDHKRYYTDGGDFSKEKVSALQYVNLLDVTGYCNMLEIPVNLRYNLSSGQHQQWFATAGLSTYLMSKEWYAFRYLSYGNLMDNAFTYTNPYHYLFSIVNLSFGYEQKLGKIGNLRVEPYVRIPLTGMGTGSLPIMSAGLNLGITRRIW